MFSHGHLHGTIDHGTPRVEGVVTPSVREPTPLRLAPKSLRPYLRALLSYKNGHDFQSKPSIHLTRRRSELAEKGETFAAAALKVSIFQP